jgi:hypothetical protein
MKALWQNARFVLSLLILLCLFSFIQWIENIVSVSHDMVEAKITQEINSSEENTILDEHNPRIKKALDTQKRHTAKLMEINDVVGTATGLASDNSPSIVVFTRKNTAPGIIPGSLEGVPVRIEVTGEIFAQPKTLKTGNPTSILPKPVPIGVSTGNIGECSAGTIGARLKDKGTPAKFYALSNNHVYALQNDAPIGSTILQPGLYDTRCVSGQSNVIGILYAYEPIDFNGGDNTVDAAIAISSDGQLKNSTPTDGYGTPNSKTYTKATGKNPYIGQRVKKYGRTTKLTTGTITGLNATIKVCYDSSCSLIATFVNQIVIGRGGFSGAGDSGSLIVTNDSNAYPVGLLFAGGGGVTIANPIDVVLDRFNLSIDGK